MTTALAVRYEHPNRCYGCGGVKFADENCCRDCRPWRCLAPFLGYCSGICYYDKNACDIHEVAL